MRLTDGIAWTNWSQLFDTKLKPLYTLASKHFLGNVIGPKLNL